MDNLGDPDIILVFGGTNDSWAGSPIGEYVWADWTDEQLYSFRPAMEVVAREFVAVKSFRGKGRRQDILHSQHRA